MDVEPEDRGRHLAPWQRAPWQARSPSDVGEDEARELIRRAEASDKGREFLVKGSQDAVAARFGVHAFVVDAARDLLGREPE